jgi:hypothetical protein
MQEAGKRLAFKSIQLPAKETIEGDNMPHKYSKPRADARSPSQDELLSHHTFARVLVTVATKGERRRIGRRPCRSTVPWTKYNAYCRMDGGLRLAVLIAVSLFNCCRNKARSCFTA